MYVPEIRSDSIVSRCECLYVCAFVWDRVHLVVLKDTTKIQKNRTYSRWWCKGFVKYNTHTHIHTLGHTQVRQFHELQIESNKECRFEATVTFAALQGWWGESPVCVCVDVCACVSIAYRPNVCVFNVAVTGHELWKGLEVTKQSSQPEHFIKLWDVMCVRWGWCVCVCVLIRLPPNPPLYCHLN